MGSSAADEDESTACESGGNEEDVTLYSVVTERMWRSSDEAPLTCLLLLLLAGELPLQRSLSVQLHALTLLLRQGGSSR